MKTAVVYGFGKFFREHRNIIPSDVKIIAWGNSDPAKATSHGGEPVEGLEVLLPEEIKEREKEFDEIWIGADSYYAREIYLSLLEHDLCKEKIKFLYRYRMGTKPFQKLDGKTLNPSIGTYRGETYKARARREREGFFEKYCKGEGLDIGHNGDLLLPTCSGWEMENGDAQYLRGVEDESFDFVYSSHCLEHMWDVQTALKNWFRVVRPGGYLIIAIPDRDLYEKKKTLPSRWNMDHEHMFLLGKSEAPDTLDILEEIAKSLSHYELEYAKRCDEGHTITDPMRQSDGEYQIEIVIKKVAD